MHNQSQQYDILLTRNPGNGYTARPLLWPELIVSGNDEAETLAHLRAALAGLLVNSQVMQIEMLAVPAAVENPWLHFAGMWADMPDDKWESFQASVAAARQELDQQQILLDVAEVAG